MASVDEYKIGLNNLSGSLYRIHLQTHAAAHLIG